MQQPRSCPALVLPGGNLSDRHWLLLLLLLTLVLRGWQVYHTELTSRDSIVYIRAAWRLEHEPIGTVLRTEAQHPGYSVLVWLFSQPMRLLLPDDLPRAMQLAAQLASSFASLLLLFPCYYLGKELFNGPVGFWATLLLQVQPSSGRMMPDGLSEPLFLLLVASALYASVRACNGGSILWFLLTGFATGLAYLTRTEGLLIVPVVVLVLLGCQFSRRWRLPWLLRTKQVVAVSASCALLTLPFMFHIGGLSLKTAYKHIRDPEGWQMPAAPVPEARAQLNTTLPLAMWYIGPEVYAKHRYGWAAWAVLATLDKSFFHVLGLPALLALWLFRRRFVEMPGAWVLLLLGLVLLPLLYKLAQSAGYIGERHVLMIVLGGMFAAVATLAALGGWLARGQHPWYSLALLLVLVALCLPKTLAKLHGNRSGFREAGEWLAANTLPGDEVFDPFAWATYYAGRHFAPPEAPRSHPPVCYVVTEQSRNKHPHLWYLLDLGAALVRHGEVVHRIPTSRGAEIVIYRAPRPPATDPHGADLNRWLAVNLRR